MKHTSSNSVGILVVCCNVKSEEFHDEINLFGGVK